MSKIHVSKYNLKDTSKLILDTNILIPLFHPMTSHKYMSDYENFYSNALKKKSQLILSSIQISEFINRCIRLQYKLFKNTNYKDKDFDFKKDYRQTTDYNNSMNQILSTVEYDIIPSFTIVNDGFDSISLDKVFLHNFSYDFNDALLIQIAELYGSDIVTHDYDFASYNTTANIITTNNFLLLYS